MTLEDVETFCVPEVVAANTEQSLRRAGHDGYELFVLWTGTKSDSRFQVQAAHVPNQTSYRSKSGLCVRVEGDALHQLNTWMYEHDETLGAQVHAHPNEAYHSDTDDTFPMVTTLGGLSLVVPDFCRAGLLAGSAAYRLLRGGWHEDPRSITELIEVI